MCSILVVVTNVLDHQTFQVSFIHDNHMAEKIAAATTDPARGDTVLPRSSEAGPLGLDAEALHGADHLFVEVGSAIKDQEFIQADCRPLGRNRLTHISLIGYITYK
jgi:hypothetical protein